MNDARNPVFGVIVQARSGSRRLPGKVLMPARGKPLIQYLLERLARESFPAMVVATSDLPQDDALAALCAGLGVECFRGPHEDVAARYRLILERRGFEFFVRVCGDSPFLDQSLVRRAVDLFRAGPCDLVTNVFPRSFPKGFSVEAMGSAAFRGQALVDAEDREHVTRYWYRHADRFAIRNFSSGADLGGIQLSVDTAEDFRLFEAVLARMERPHWDYGYAEVIDLYRSAAGRRV